MSDKLKYLINVTIDRLGENSTWRGIILLLTSLGVVLTPDQAAKIVAAGLAVVGVINIFRQGSPTKSQVAEALATKQDKV